MVKSANRRRDTGIDFAFDNSVIQTREVLLASALLLRCDLLILSDFLSLRSRAPATPSAGKLTVDLSSLRTNCDNVINLAATSNQPRQQVEAHIFFAHSAALERVSLHDHGLDAAKLLKETGENHLAEARQICTASEAPTKGLLAEVEEVARMLRDGVFYTQVTTQEWHEVVAAMATVFRGTGHWYFCENGHPYTVGECGAPMAISRCPQCGAPVGGSNHQSVAGVRHAADIERDFGRLSIGA